MHRDPIGGNLVRAEVFKVVLMVLFLLAVTITGCISTGNGGQTPVVSPTSKGSTVTPVPTVGDKLAVNFMSDLPRVRWYEYQITPSGTPVMVNDPVTTEHSAITERWDFNTDYQGKPADKATGTITYPGSGSDFTGVCTAFLNPANHAQVLGGNVTAYENGGVLTQADITTRVLDLLMLLDLTNSTYAGQHTVTYGGMETVSVPYGTYDTTRYLYNSTLNFTVYMNQSVPIPVKVVAVSPEGTIYDVQLKKYEMSS